MIALTAREALDPRVARVTTTMRPVELAEPARRMGLYAVFDDESGRFLRLVPAQDATPFPHRIFADLLPKSPPAPVVADASLDAVSDRMATEGVEALPVLDEQGAFLGVIARTSLLDALLRRERELLAETRGLYEDLHKDQQRLMAWSKRLEELNQAAFALLGLVARTPVEQSLLQGGLQALTTLVQARFGAIGILTEAGELQQFVFTGLTAEEAERIGEWPQGRGLLGAVIRENQVLRLQDLTQDPRHAGFPPNHPLMKGFLAVPISHQGQVYGRVYLCDKTTGGPFTENDERLAVSFARSLALAFAHARELAERRQAEEALKARSREQQILLRFSQILLGLLDPEAIARASFEVLREHLQPDGIGLRVPDANGTHLEMIAAEGWMKEHIDDLRVPLEPPEISGAAWAVHTRTPVFGDHTRPDRPFAGPEMAQKAGVKACLHVPILIQQRVVGVLTINSLTPRTYTDEEVRFVTLVTNQVGIALDRANKHQRLREAELWLRAVFDSLDEALFVVTPDRRVVNMNSAAQRMLGYTLEEIKHQSTERAHVDHDHYVQFGERIADAFRRGEAAQFEFRLRRKSGEVFPTEHTVSLLKGGAGEPLGIVSVVRDITERKQAEEALREMNVALENAMPGISRLDPEGRYVSVNDVYARMLGYEPNEMIGRAWAPTVHPDDQQNAIAAYERMLSEGKAEFEARAVRKDGSVFHKQVLMVRIVHKDGKFIGHHCFMRDITERRRAEESLQALYRASLQIQEPLGLQERLARLLQTARDVLHLDRLNILLADPEGRWLEGVATLGTKEPPEAMRVPIGPEGGGIAQAYLSQQPIVWWDSQVPVPEPIRLQPPYNRLEAFRSRAFALLPLVVQGRAIGVLGGDRKHSRRPLDPATLDLMHLFAAQAAIAIENARLYEATVQRAWQLGTLNEVSRTLTTLLDPRRVAQEILAAVQVLIPGAAGRLWERVGETDVLRLVAAVGLREPEGGNTLRLSPREGLAGIAAATRQPVISPDVTSDARFANQAWAAAEGLVACIVLPLIYGERVHGVLLIFTHEPHTFTDEEVSLLRSFAAQAAIALENARLFEQVQAGRKRLQVLSRKLVEVQEAERRHIARELHDEIGQVLTGLKLTLEMSSRLPADAIKTSLGEAQTLVNDLIAQVRELSLDLRPAILDDLGLLPALLAHFERYTAKTRVRVAFEHAGLGRRFPAEVETAAYRIVQEALTNIARHAGVGEASVGLWADEERLGVHIEDGGVGFDPDAVLSAVTSSGLVGMRERAVLVGGHLSVESAPGAGTRVMADLPLGRRFEKRKKER